MKIAPVKGRPMLQWVGKQPLDRVNYYPAQLVETYNTKTPPLQNLHTVILSPVQI